MDDFWFRSYNYPYPAFKNKQVCDYYKSLRVETTPLFRRSSLERMRQECQCFKSTISADPAHHSYGSVTAPAIPSEPPVDFLARPRIRHNEYARWRFDTTPVVTKQTRSEWNNFLNRCPRDSTFNFRPSCQGKELRYTIR